MQPLLFLSCQVFIFMAGMRTLVLGELLPRNTQLLPTTSGTVHLIFYAVLHLRMCSLLAVSKFQHTKNLSYCSVLIFFSNFKKFLTFCKNNIWYGKLKHERSQNNLYQELSIYHVYDILYSNAHNISDNIT